MPYDAIGVVSELWRFPVKSMQGERLDEIGVLTRGCIGDRAYALVETDSGKVVSAKSVKRFPDLLSCRAAFVEPPRASGELPPVRVTLPNGVSVASDSAGVDEVLSRYFGAKVALASAAPEDFTIDQYHPDLEHLDPTGHRDTFVEQKLGSALFAEMGLTSPVPVGAFFDVFPISILTTSTLDRLRELGGRGHADVRRFRMNAIVKTDRPGFVEHDWLEREIAVGDTMRLSISMSDPRCVMTTLAQDDLPRDGDVLRTLVQHNRIPVGPGGEYPCAGVYAGVTAPGTIRVGDPVRLGSAPHR